TVLRKLADFAAKTPFDFPTLQKAASRLIAVGTEADRVIPIMTVLGDATAAMGTGAEGVDRAVMALQQMQVKGKVTGEEMLQ
uniref:tape measure protein n=1 Tax=Salmonella enterica TaxID=28901 RepID=UPI0032997464